MSDNKDEREGDIPLVIHGYGIRLHLQSHPDELDEPVPTSWAEVRKQLMRHLMRIAVGPTALLATAFESTTRLISGLSRVPKSVSRVVESVRSSADERQRDLQAQVAEETRDRLVVGTESTNSAAEFALSKIETILQGYSAKGVDAYIVMGPNDQIIVVWNAQAVSRKF
jgi:intracellular sulfur oxidation DsrE/DsrF family protein